MGDKKHQNIQKQQSAESFKRKSHSPDFRYQQKHNKNQEILIQLRPMLQPDSHFEEVKEQQDISVNRMKRIPLGDLSNSLRSDQQLQVQRQRGISKENLHRGISDQNIQNFDMANKGQQRLSTAALCYNQENKNINIQEDHYKNQDIYYKQKYDHQARVKSQERTRIDNRNIVENKQKRNYIDMQRRFEFDETEYDNLKVEKPDKLILKSQAAIIKGKELKELPSIQQIKGPSSNPNNEPIYNGHGYFRFSEGVSYEGQFKNGKRHGLGYLMNNDSGWDFLGEFSDNHIHGFGKYIWNSGDVYVGYFTFNEKNGFGIYRWQNGSCYKGFWKNNKKHGLGEYIYPEKSYYYGYYSYDKPDGLGVYVWPDGNYYQGEWKNGSRSGLGYFKWAKNKAHYIGWFKDNFLEGKGAFHYEDGSYYKGEFVKNKREGYGKSVWSDNSFYIGFWSNGEKNGMGKMVSPSGDVTEGVWKNGKRVNN